MPRAATTSSTSRVGVLCSFSPLSPNCLTSLVSSRSILPASADGVVLGEADELAGVLLDEPGDLLVGPLVGRVLDGEDHRPVDPRLLGARRRVTSGSAKVVHGAVIASPVPAWQWASITSPDLLSLLAGIDIPGDREHTPRQEPALQEVASAHDPSTPRPGLGMPMWIRRAPEGPFGQGEVSMAGDRRQRPAFFHSSRVARLQSAAMASRRGAPLAQSHDPPDHATLPE